MSEPPSQPYGNNNRGGRGGGEPSGYRGRGWRGGGGGGWRGRGGGQGRGERGNYNKPWSGRGSSFSKSTGHMNIPATPDSSMPPPACSTPRQFVQSNLHVASPYVGWTLYFPDTVYSEHSPVLKHVQLFEKYFISWGKLFDREDIELKRSFTVDFKDMYEDKNVQEDFPDLNQELKTSPESILSCLGLAMHQVITLQHKEDMTSRGEDQEEAAYTVIPDESHMVPHIIARVKNFGTPLALKNFKANYYGKFVSVKGTVVRVGNIKPLCVKLAFRCASCSYVQAVPLPDGKYTQPTKCPENGCRSRTFTPFRGNSLTETVDWQTIRVQELMSDDQKDSGRIPRTIDCELTRDLVDSCVPGDIVTVTGVVKVNKVDEGRPRSKDKCMFLLYLHGNHVQNSKGCKRRGRDEGSTGSGLAMDFSTKDLYAIKEIHSQKNLFSLLVASLRPSIFGHEMVKAGIVLGLFGSSPKFANDKNRIPVRGDPHILIVGDPGLGKSQLLQAATSVAPRSVYVCGNTTTTSGLTSPECIVLYSLGANCVFSLKYKKCTFKGQDKMLVERAVTLSKDSGSGDFALEAGALVLADQGCCCIDEFDKMASQHQALLEAMEQQSISIAKAGIVCSLPARTSILAAANPVGGHYNKGKTVAENLKMGSALLSRFDLVFILLDKPDEEMDCMLSDHVMALHAGGKGLQGSVRVRRENIMNESSQMGDRLPLNDYLKSSRSEVTDPLPHQLMRKYVAYARKYVHPKIGKEAAQIIQDFYLTLRKQHQRQDSTPITTRQLESLIRLTEARARLELREVATESDAQDVVELMKYSMQDVYSDQFGLLDFQRSQHGSGMSGRSMPKRFVSALQRVAEQTYNNIFTVQQMRQIAKEINMQIPDFEGFLSSLNNQGYLLKKGNKVYQLQTFD